MDTNHLPDDVLAHVLEYVLQGKMLATNVTVQDEPASLSLMTKNCDYWKLKQVSKRWSTILTRHEFHRFQISRSTMINLARTAYFSNAELLNGSGACSL